MALCGSGVFKNLKHRLKRIIRSFGSMAQVYDKMFATVSRFSSGALWKK